MSDTSLLAMVTRMMNKRGKAVTVEKLSSAVADANAPWNGNGAQTVLASTLTRALFLPATGHGLGREIVRDNLLGEIAEIVILKPLSTGEDFRDYHTILDDGIQKRISKCWTVSPSSTPILFVASIAK